MQSYITGSPAADILIALGTAGSMWLSVILARARKEPPKPGTPDAVVIALAANTAATNKLIEMMARQSGDFGENLTQFRIVVALFRETLAEIRIIKSAAEANREHLNSIRERTR